MQLNFLDEPRIPTPTDKARQKLEILNALKAAGSHGVTMLRMREVCPASLTQRISDLRADGFNIVCRRTEAGYNEYVLVEKTQ